MLDTTIIAQYHNLKKQYKDYLIFYRIGEFYELFASDAKLAAEILNLKLTTKTKQKVPMCGIPASSIGYYIKKLVSLHYKIAIYDQVSIDINKKVQREITRLITPGTLLEEELLERKNNYYLAALSMYQDIFCLAWLDVSVKEFYYSKIPAAKLTALFAKISPVELLISQSLQKNEVVQNILRRYKCTITTYAFKSKHNAACVGIIEYVNTIHRNLQLHDPIVHDSSNYLEIDAIARNSLELFTSNNNDLFTVIDYTLTAGGGRLLKKYLTYPLTDIAAIDHRLNIIDFYITNAELRKRIRQILQRTPDLERGITQLSITKYNAIKNLTIIRDGLDITLQLSGLLLPFIQNEYIMKIYQQLNKYSEIVSILKEALNDYADYRISQYFHPKLEDLHYTKNNSKNLLDKLAMAYRKTTAIPRLQIGFNSIIGYYIEIPNKDTLEDEKFIHKQSLNNSIRYITNELKELESKILNTECAIKDLENRLIDEITDRVLIVGKQIINSAKAINESDVMCALAELAVCRKYTRPILTQQREFIVTNGRHPLLEQRRKFVANSLTLDQCKQLCFITGPNMGGKSTFLRQNALIAILAQMGSFVPAEYAKIGIIDRIFTRIGAADNLCEGQSTFMLEMCEVATIVHCATERSLVLIDEIGRGTATHDGIAIAYAVIKYLHDVNNCRTLLASHYYNLFTMMEKFTKICYYCVKVVKEKGEIKFLYKVTQGKEYHSYGIDIAELAGMPAAIINTSQEILNNS